MWPKAKEMEMSLRFSRNKASSRTVVRGENREEKGKMATIGTNFCLVLNEKQKGLENKCVGGGGDALEGFRQFIVYV